MQVFSADGALEWSQQGTIGEGINSSVLSTRGAMLSKLNWMTLIIPVDRS